MLKFDEELIGCYGGLYNRRGIPSIILSPLRYLVRIIANWYIPISYKRTEYLSYYHCGKRIIVSLTSFPARIDKVWITIESLKRQTVQADKIILWLSKEQFPGMDNDLPEMLVSRQDDCFEVRFVDDDIRSHKKYYYAFQNFKDDIVITVDDDIIYPTDAIEVLMEGHEKYPNSVICRYGLIMTYDEEDRLRPYNEWIEDYECYSESFFFGSGGGTLFQPKLLVDDVLNKDLFLRLTPIADDVWLNAVARVSGLDIKVVSKDLLLPILEKNNRRLTEENVYQNKNDIQINNVRDYFGKKGIVPFEKNNR